jgi:nucleotide-binding universal stress UspA family protein
VTHILCPIDLSDISSHVVDHASALARWYGARLTLLHVVIDGPAMGGIPPLPIEAAHRQELTAAMRKASGSVPASVQTDFVVRQAADAGTAILDLVAEQAVDLLVLGTHGRSGFKRLLLGSVAEWVIRRSSCATLVVPPRAADVAAGTPIQFRRIVCAVDFSESSRVAAAQAIRLTRQTAAHLTLFHVISRPPELYADTTGSEFNVNHIRAAAEADALRRLRELIPREPDMPGTIETAVEEGDPERWVLRKAAELNADLVVLGVHGRSAADLLVFGSTANHVVRAATCPVLIVRHG